MNDPVAQSSDGRHPGASRVRPCIERMMGAKGYKAHQETDTVRHKVIAAIFAKDPTGGTMHLVITSVKHKFHTFMPDPGRP
jgi:hypothetical protein